MSDAANSTNETKLAWVEPAVVSLNIEETHNLPNRGADGNRHADCTRS